jgi:hypothetical protein
MILLYFGFAIIFITLIDKLVEFSTQLNNFKMALLLVSCGVIVYLIIG